MTEIEKMFENAGIKKQYCGWLDMGDLDCQMQYVRCNSITEWKDAVFSSRFGESKEEPEHKYPPFTAEKQLELIKWLAKTYELSINWDKQYFAIRNYYDNGRLYHSVYGYEVPFDETFAYLINRIWQDLTDQEKEEIRGILNENS